MQTEIVVTYLKGPPIEWWRGTEFIASIMPWYRFSRHIWDKFSEASICYNARPFHSLTQTTIFKEHILQFEYLINEPYQER